MVDIDKLVHSEHGTVLEMKVHRSSDDSYDIEVLVRVTGTEDYRLMMEEWKKEGFIPDRRAPVLVKGITVFTITGFMEDDYESDSE